MIESYEKKRFCFYIDGVICRTKKNNYKNAKPIKKVIILINKLYKNNYIIIFTARYMVEIKIILKKLPNKDINKHSTN